MITLLGDTKEKETVVKIEDEGVVLPFSPKVKDKGQVREEHRKDAKARWAERCALATQKMNDFPQVLYGYDENHKWLFGEIDGEFDDEKEMLAELNNRNESPSNEEEYEENEYPDNYGDYEYPYYDEEYSGVRGKLG